ncbi:MAG: dehydrogenase [Verrucomicrobia bacterium]|nr:MAG: dehydrogenase [Verrucomicrobiota bacterium]
MSPRRRASGSSPTPTTMAWLMFVRSGIKARPSPAAPTTFTVRTSAWMAGFTGAKARSPRKPTSGPARNRSCLAPRTFSGRRPIIPGGMDNPVGVAFTPEGERILCGTFFATHEPGHRDGLIHAIYGGVYGKINDVTDDHKKTGDLMPIMTHMGPAACCSVICYDSRVFGAEYRGNLFLCSFNLHKVTRHILEPNGATFKTRDSDFLTSDSTDFHPTDVIEDADGSLIVLDTGGWYKICCPTSQLSKPDLLGAIYRIRRTGAPKVEDPRGLKLAWNRLKPSKVAALLGDERPAVRKRAIYELSRRKTESIPALSSTLKKSPSVEARRNAVWALTRIDDPKAREAVYAALPSGKNSFLHADDSVAQAAICSIALWRDKNAILAPSGNSRFAVSGLPDALDSANPAIRRIAAEALGRLAARDYSTSPSLHARGRGPGGGGIGEAKREEATFAVRHLLNMIESGPLDRVLEHSLIYALIETDDPESTTAGLSNRASQRAALIALDQMDHGSLKPEAVVPFLKSHDTELRKTAAWVAGHHPNWGGALAGFFRERLASNALSDAERAELEHQLTQFARSEAVQHLVASVLNQSPAPLEVRQLLLHVMAQAALKESPPGWTEALRSCLAQSDDAVLVPAVGAARALSQTKPNAPSFSEALLRIARDATHLTSLRLEALAALPNGLRPVEPELLTFLFTNLQPARPVLSRNAATAVLARAKLSDDQFLALAGTLQDLGPLEVPKLLPAYEHCSNEAVGLKLIAALKESKAISSLRPDLLKPVLAKYPASVQQPGSELLALLNADAAKQSAHLEELLPSLKNGDIRRGQAVFNSQKAACFTCHALGYQGGHVGPDLTKIGEVRTERDLLEAIVYPSASFVRSYEPYVVTTKSEETYTGVLRKDAADEVVLATGADTEVHVGRDDIRDMHPGSVSLMPAGLDQQLTKQELADLLAFLKATKWGPR